MILKSTHSTPTILWLSDLHLDMADTKKKQSLLKTVTENSYDAIVCSGDISSAPSLIGHLRELAEACAPRPLYFVLGNHDFYQSSMAAVDKEVARLCRSVTNLHHLGGNEIIPLSRSTALIGHRGWADARAGYGRRTVIDSRDHHYIRDFQHLGREAIFTKMESLGKESAGIFRKTLPHALSAYGHVVIATHIPPFPETAHFNAKPCGLTHLPHYVNFSAGIAMVGISQKFPKKNVTVLAGHTHSPVRKRILDNLEVRVAGAQTGAPASQGVLSFT